VYAFIAFSTIEIPTIETSTMYPPPKAIITSYFARINKEIRKYNRYPDYSMIGIKLIPKITPKIYISLESG